MDYGEFDATRLILWATTYGEALDWDRDFHLVSPAFTAQHLKIKHIQPADGHYD